MPIGRMTNAGQCLADLRQDCAHDPRTMTQWAAVPQSDDPEFIVRCILRSRTGTENDPGGGALRGATLPGEAAVR